MKQDSNTTIQELRRVLKRFRDDRDWAQFHDPKNLAEAIAVEASELLELFLWKSPAEVSRTLKSDRRLRKAVEEELADIFCYALSFSNATELDVTRAVIEKIKSNGRKYPVAKVRGVATKYDKL